MVAKLSLRSITASLQRVVNVRRRCRVVDTSVDSWARQRRTPTGRWSHGWWSRCCHTELSPTPGRSRTWVLCPRTWSATRRPKQLSHRVHTELTVQLPLSCDLTIVLQRGSPSGSVRFPPYATGSCSGSMCFKRTSCQLPASRWLKIRTRIRIRLLTRLRSTGRG